MHEEKAIAAMSREEEGDFAALIEELHGGPELDGEPLNAEPASSFDSAADLIHGRRQPDGPNEAAALGRYQRRVDS
jgi:hypothetical protein